MKLNKSDKLSLKKGFTIEKKRILIKWQFQKLQLCCLTVVLTVSYRIALLSELYQTVSWISMQGFETTGRF